MDEQQATDTDQTDDDALKQRLVNRIAVTAVILAGLLGLLAMFGSLNGASPQLGLGGHYLVLAVAAVAGIYLVLSVMRLVQAGRRPLRSAPKPLDIGLDLDLTAKRRAAPTTAEAELESEANIALDVDLTEQSPAAPGTAKPGRAREVVSPNVDAELQRVQRESGLLRQELDRLTDEVARLKVARNASSQHNETPARGGGEDKRP